MKFTSTWKGKWFLIITLIVTGSFLTRCAPTEQVNMLEKRVNGLSIQNREIIREIQILKERTSDLKSLKKSIEKADKKDILNVRSQLADLNNRIDDIQAELLRINGQIDQVDHQDNLREKETEEFRQDIQKEIDAIKEQINLLQASSKVAKEVEQVRKEAAQGKIDLYQQGLDLIKQKKFEDAKKTLKSYIEEHPQGKLVANAYFWIGECEYNLQRYEESILEYQKVISQYPKSNKVPDALLKQGLAFARLGDNESAKIVLRKLVTKFPKTPQARVAKKQLKRF